MIPFLYIYITIKHLPIAYIYFFISMFYITKFILFLDTWLFIMFLLPACCMDHHTHTHTHTASLDLEPPSSDWGGFPGGSASKESACNVGDLGSIPGLGRSAGEGKGYPLQYSWLENPHGHRSLVGCSPWGRKESDMTEWLSTAQPLIGRVLAGAWASAFSIVSNTSPQGCWRCSSGDHSLSSTALQATISIIKVSTENTNMNMACWVERHFKRLSRLIITLNYYSRHDSVYSSAVFNKHRWLKPQVLILMGIKVDCSILLILD